MRVHLCGSQGVKVSIGSRSKEGEEEHPQIWRGQLLAMCPTPLTFLTNSSKWASVPLQSPIQKPRTTAHQY